MGDHGGLGGAITRRAMVQGGAALLAMTTLPGRLAARTAPGEIVNLDALALSRAIHSKQLSCVEVMGAYLDRIERINPKVNAIVALQSREGLIAQARARDEALARGASSGWMHGFPLAAKDLTAVKGLPFTSGSPIFKDRIADVDSAMVARMRAAGGIFIGKTNTPEFGFGSQTYNPVYGTTLNAYDQRKTAGGSSGGAAVAVATRMLPVADGSDMGGSLRNPAGWNNVFGFRPTFGRVPGGGGFMMDMSVNGPMARTVPELAMLLATLAGPFPLAPLAIDEDPAIFGGALTGDIKGLRVGWLGNFGTLPMEPGVLEVCKGALGVFESLGATVGEATVPAPLEDAWRDWVTLRAWGNAASLGSFYDDPERRALLKPEAQWEVERGRRLSGGDVAAALAGRQRWYQAFAGLFDRFDILVAPTAQVFAFDAATHWPTEIAGTAMDSYHRWMQIVTPITMSGCPALAVPAGFSPVGQPMGLQLVAPLRRELDCLKVANAYDRATRWAERRPPTLG